MRVATLNALSSAVSSATAGSSFVRTPREYPPSATSDSTMASSNATSRVTFMDEILAESGGPEVHERYAERLGGARLPIRPPKGSTILRMAERIRLRIGNLGKAVLVTGQA